MPKTKLTPEEKKALRLAKKQEKKRLAELRKKQIKYDHLGREIRYGQQTIAKHEKSWRQMLISIALPRMRYELEYAWHNFERVIDDKDFTISLLMDELNEAEDQYMRNVRSHTDNIDNLIVLCYDQIQDLRNDSREVIHNLYQAATFERTDIINITKENEEYLKTMLYILDNTKKESEKLIRGEYLSKQEVEISRLNDICSKFTEELEEKYTKTWRETNAFLKDHISECAVRRREFTQLNTQDEQMQRLIRKLWDNIRKNLETIKSMKRGFDEVQLTQSRKVEELTCERNHFDGVFRRVKRILEDERLLDEKNLTILTLESNSIIAFLQDLEKRGEKLLKLSAICRKFETLEEKTAAFPIYSNIQADTAAVNEINIVDLEDVYRPEIVTFFDRLAQAESTRYKTNEEAEYLKLKNNSLRRNIQKYCQCFACDDV